jgi:hypothetical protein
MSVGDTKDVKFTSMQLIHFVFELKFMVLQLHGAFCFTV